MGILKGLIPQSLAGRMLLALLLCFALLFSALVAVHDVLLQHAVRWSTDELLAQRLATVLDAVAATPEGSRDSLSQALSKPGLRVDVLPFLERTDASLIGPRVRDIAERADSLLNSRAELSVISGATDPGSGDLLGITAVARMSDNLLVRIQMTTPNLVAAELWWLYTQAVALGVILLVAVGIAARTVAAPVTRLAASVARMDATQEGKQIPLTGPREVRLLAETLNSMAERTRDVFRQRTLALAALSHDLMSPIARLRLRSEDLPPAQQFLVQKDLAEMETMVSDVLAYLRGGHGGEQQRPLALAALVRTVVGEFEDIGETVDLREISSDVVVEARQIGVKRAVTNLLNNALRHGRDPWIEVVTTPTSAILRVGDHGPGIPEEDLPRVVEPFFRGDRARSAGGGSGLGLATVQAIAASHGGTLRIISHQGIGTIAELHLPLRDAHPPMSA